LKDAFYAKLNLLAAWKLPSCAIVLWRQVSVKI